MNKRQRATKHARKYAGAHLSQGRWASHISLRPGGIRKNLRLGTFANEIEAAFAFRVATELTRDPDFVSPDLIPDEDLPDFETQARIRAVVVGKLKAVLEGRKTILTATSKYRGVSFISGKWQVAVRQDGLTVNLGRYVSEDEAGFAYNYGAKALGCEDFRPNDIPPIDPERAKQITSLIELRISRRLSGDRSHIFWPT